MHPETFERQMHLLKEQGYEVIGVTMQIWQDEAEEIQEMISKFRKGE